MKDFSPGKRRSFGGRNSDRERSGGRFERREGGNREDRGESRFRSRDNDRGERRFSSSSDRPRFERREVPRKFERHTVTCDACGNSCEVPFKPTSSKPVYCSDCFKKNDRFAAPAVDTKQAQSFVEEFERINIKLDKIMKALNIK